MNLIAASESATFSLDIPEWVLWGTCIAVGVMVLMYAGSWLFAKVWETMTFGFMGTAKDMEWPSFGKFIAVFATFGLLPGLTAAYLWAHDSQLSGVLAGVGLFLAVWGFWGANEKRKSGY